MAPNRARSFPGVQGTGTRGFELLFDLLFVEVEIVVLSKTVLYDDLPGATVQSDG
jgi:hypothetical protein